MKVDNFIKRNHDFSLKNQFLIFSHVSSPIEVKLAGLLEETNARRTVLLRGPNSSIPVAYLKIKVVNSWNYPLREG